MDVGPEGRSLASTPDPTSCLTVPNVPILMSYPDYPPSIPSLLSQPASLGWIRTRAPKRVLTNVHVNGKALYRCNNESQCATLLHSGLHEPCERADDALASLGLHMDPNNLCCVTRHFLFFRYVPMSLFIRP